MKTYIIKSVLAFFAISMILNACSKEEITLENSIADTDQIINLKDHRIFLNGNPAEKMINGDDVITIVDCQKKETYQFTDDRAFEKWSNSEGSLKSTNGINLYKTNCQLNEIANLAEELGITDTYEYGDDLPIEITTLLEKMGYNQYIEEKNAITWTTLYDGTNYIEQLCILNTFFNPALVKEHRNKAESMKLIGVNGTWYCDETWFRGEKRYFITLTHYFLPDFEDFNNKIESVFSIM